MTILEVQFEYLAVKKDLWFMLEVTLVFLDIDLQHLRPWIPQPAEWPSRLGRCDWDGYLFRGLHRVGSFSLALMTSGLTL